jgi:tRNA-Thr(GGU) m(6)t(6)A37 methyltransferase TsaA
VAKLNIQLKPIGVVHVDVDDEAIRNSWSGVKGVVEVFREYGDGLNGIDGFSHLILIAYLHKVTDDQRRTLKVRPKRFLRFNINISDLPEVGVFCTDSPHRPNPIALTIVRLIKREELYLHVEGLDLFNGTPILDIKPYTPNRRIADVNVPKWYETLACKAAGKLDANAT